MHKFILLSFALLFSSSFAFAQEWTQVASLPSAFSRTHHSFGFALDGKGYLVTGGSNAGVRDDFYQYDPVADEWTQLDDFPGAARAFAIGDTLDGKAYFGFGSANSQYFNDLWVFDPVDTAWTELTSCPCTPRTHPAFLAHNGKVFMGLGGSLSFGNLNDWWEYDIATDTWSQKEDLPAPPRHHPYQFAIDEYVYVGFGHGTSFISNNWFRYDPANEEWTEVATLPAEGRVAGTQFSYDGLGYVLSGDGEDHRSMETGEFWSYDPVFDEWMELPPHPGKSRWAPASFILDGEVYIINGDSYINNDYFYQEEVYKFDLEGGVISTSQVDETAAWQLFPNPFSDHLQLTWRPDIDLTKTTVSIFDIHNRLLYHSSNVSNTLQLAHLPNGWLRVELVEGEHRYSQVVLKQ